MPRHLRVILILGAIASPRDTWRHRVSFMREWKRGGW
jgi:hypothetical protein